MAKSTMIIEIVMHAALFSDRNYAIESKNLNCENSQRMLAISSIKNKQGMKSLLILDLTRQYR